MKKALQITTILSFLVLSSCDKDTPVAVTDLGELIPLKVGNSWIGTYRGYDSTGTVLSERVESLYVFKDTTVDGKRYFVLKNYPDHAWLVRNTSAGYNELQTDFDSTDHTLYRYPYPIGDSSVAKSSERITVPAGTFDCIVYRQPIGIINADTDWEILYGQTYICPNVGIIAREWPHHSKTYIERRYVLNRFILN